MEEISQNKIPYAYLNTELGNSARYADQRLYLLDDLTDLYNKYSLLRRLDPDLNEVQRHAIDLIVERLGFEIAARRYEGRQLQTAVHHLLNHGETDIISQLE